MNRADVIRGLVEESGVHFKQNSRSFILHCPRCRKPDKLYIRRSDGRFVCWVCRDSEGFEGSPEWVFTELLGIPVPELRKRIYGDQIVTPALWLDVQLLDYFGEDEFVPEHLQIPELDEVLPDPGFRELESSSGGPGLRYLMGRGVDIDTMAKYDIKYWPAKKSVVFPVMSRGRWLGWQTRYIGPKVDEEGNPIDVPKAVTSWGLKKDRTFMLADNLQGTDHAVLCEGPIDGFKAELCGGNVVSLGKAVSDWQLRILKNSGIRKLYNALDPDAFKESQRVLKELVTDIEVYDMRPPKGFEDIGAMTQPDVLELYRRAPRIDAAFLYVYLENRYAN